MPNSPPEELVLLLFHWLILDVLLTGPVRLLGHFSTAAVRGGCATLQEHYVIACSPRMHAGMPAVPAVVVKHPRPAALRAAKYTTTICSLRREQAFACARKAAGPGDAIEHRWISWDQHTRL